jgi:lysophospholipase L1-like esterase
MNREQRGRATEPEPSQNQARRLLWLSLITLLLLLAGLVYWHFWHHFPIGTGPAGSRVPAEAFAKPWTQRQVLLVGMGDSVTAGFGARRGHGYFDLVAAGAPDDFPDVKGRSLSAVLPKLAITNLAVSGSVSRELIEGQLPRLPTNAPGTFGIVVITTGGNDLIHNYGRTPPRECAMYGATVDEAAPWVLSFRSRLDRIVTEITNRFPGGCRIFLANIYDPTDGFGDIKRTGLPAWPDGTKVLDAYNEAILHCAERHKAARIVNLHDAFLGHGIHCAQFWTTHYDRSDPHNWYYDNLEDPNERGYDAIRRLFLIEIAKAAPEMK